MIEHKDECIDCGLPCFDSCKYKNVTYFYCDCCNEEAEVLYVYDNGKQLCQECLLSQFEKIMDEYDV